MGIKEPRASWLGGEEFGEARRKLLQAGLDDDSPEMRALWKQVGERDEYLWDRYARPNIPSHSGEWAAVGLDGEIIFGPTASAIIWSAAERFGDGNFVYGRMAEFRGHVL